jgi:ABC-type Zn2+ transport system substrate-binding protein/surface adhesin
VVLAAAAAVAESLSCCDLTIAGAADTDWAATLIGKGEDCEDDHSHAAKNATAAVDHDSHAGHDHGDHAGHDHSNMTTTAQAPATSARSSAGVAAGSAAVATVAAVLAIAAIL